MPDQYRCNLCWQEFASPVALLEHEALEDDRLYEVDGLGALEVRRHEVR